MALSKKEIAKIADAVVARLQQMNEPSAETVETVRASMREGRGTIVPGLAAMPTNRIELPENEQTPLRTESQQNEFDDGVVDV